MKNYPPFIHKFIKIYTLKYGTEELLKILEKVNEVSSNYCHCPGNSPLNRQITSILMPNLARITSVG